MPSDRNRSNFDFTEPLLAVAAEYTKYTKRGDRLKWITGLCTAPPTLPMISSGQDGQTHGRKLYYLFVKDDKSYQALASATALQPAGQALVKESYRPIEVAEQQFEHWTGAQAKGRYFNRGEMYALFVMLKYDSTTPGTHNGWVYGTLTPDGKFVTSQGKVESCIGCHDDAPHDQLYGP